MAIYHLSGNPISRGKGRSMTAAAAYCSASRIRDQRTGQAFDWRRKEGVILSEIIAPEGSPAWAYERAEVWNRAELAEEQSTRRATATTGREFRVALPHEISADARLFAVRDFCRYLVSRYNVLADFSIHEPDRNGDQRNFHAHILISDRVLTAEGFGRKVRELNIANGGRAEFQTIRAKWAKIANWRLELAAKSGRVDSRSNSARGIENVPTVHLGYAASLIERRGVASMRGDANRNIIKENAIRAQYRERLKARSDGKLETMTFDPLGRSLDTGRRSDGRTECVSTTEIVADAGHDDEKQRRRRWELENSKAGRGR